MVSKLLIAMALMLPLMGCPAAIPQTEPLFSDVSRNPPPITESTRAALKADRPFGEWVLYQAELCKRHGCI